MSDYTVLDAGLNPLGQLTLSGSGGATRFWGDEINVQIADDGGSDSPINDLSQTFNAIDVNSNSKNWNHTLNGITFEGTELGAKIVPGAYLLYQDDSNNKHYLMSVTEVTEDGGNYHARTAVGVNSAIVDFKNKIVPVRTFEKSLGNQNPNAGTLKNVATHVFGGTGWSIDTVEYNYPMNDFIFDGKTSAQAALQDINKNFGVEMDAYVQINSQGRIVRKVLLISPKLGSNNGVLLTPDKYQNITAQEVSSDVYTKLYIYGADSMTIGAANSGLTYIVDDRANQLIDPVGHASYPRRYREGVISNESISEPQALLDWGKAQLKLLNHTRMNYKVDVMSDLKVALGDYVRVQDEAASNPIYLGSRVMQRKFSFADPSTNEVTLGEFASMTPSTPSVMQSMGNLIQVTNETVHQVMANVSDVVGRVDVLENDLITPNYVAGVVSDALNSLDSSVVSVTTRYAVSDENVKPTSGWSTTMPTFEKGQFLWTKTESLKTDDSILESYNVQYIPLDGQQGLAGSLGVYAQSVEPGNPTANMIWFDTSTTPATQKIYINDQWTIYKLAVANLYSQNAWITTAMVESLSGEKITANSIAASKIKTTEITALGSVTAGSFNLGNGNFKVDTAGNLTAKNATLTGGSLKTGTNNAYGIGSNGQGELSSIHTPDGSLQLFGAQTTFDTSDSLSSEHYTTTIKNNWIAGTNKSVNFYISSGAEGEVRITNHTAFTNADVSSGNYGNIRAKEFVKNSSILFKENIEPLEVVASEMIDGLNVVKYDLINSDGDIPKEIGFIAEHLPTELSTENNDGIAMGNLLTMTVKALQESNDIKRLQNSVIDELTIQIGELNAR